jgi:hypothetical protein
MDHHAWNGWWLKATAEQDGSAAYQVVGGVKDLLAIDAYGL